MKLFRLLIFGLALLGLLSGCFCLVKPEGRPVRIVNHSRHTITLDWSNPPGSFATASSSQKLAPGMSEELPYKEGGYPEPHARRLIVRMDNKIIVEIQFPPGQESKEAGQFILHGQKKNLEQK